MQKLCNLPNIGKTIETWLNQADIYTREDLERVGSSKAWVMIVTQNQGRHICKSTLYAIESALLDIPWHFLPQERKDELDLELPPELH